MTTTQQQFDRIIENVLSDVDAGEYPEFSELSDTDKRDLMASYIKNNEDIIYDLFANVHETSMAHHFVALIENRLDYRILAVDLRRAIVDGPDLETLIQGELDIRWGSHLAERLVAQSEYQALEEDR